MAKAPTFKSLTKAAEAGYHGKAVNIEGKGLQKVAFADKEYDKRMAKRSAKSSATDPLIDRARAAIDRAEGERPMRPVARPKRDTSKEPIATKVETPKVTTTELAPSGQRAATSGQAPSRDGEVTRAQWRDMTRQERRDAGYLTSRYAKASSGSTPRPSSARRMAMGGMVKSGYAKGGMIKANCGASMKPTQKGTKK